MIVVLKTLYIEMSISAQAFVFIFLLFMFTVCVGGFSWFGFENKIQDSEISNKTLPSLGPIEEIRGKKKGRFAINLLFALFIIKGVLIPIAFKIMAVMSSVAVVLSTMSLIVASLVGYSKLAWKHAGPTIKFIQAADPWSKDENIYKGAATGVDILGDPNELTPDLLPESLEHHHYHYQK